MINSTSESLKDSASKVGFRLMAFNGTVASIKAKLHLMLRPYYIKLQ